MSMALTKLERTYGVPTLVGNTHVFNMDQNADTVKIITRGGSNIIVLPPEGLLGRVQIDLRSEHSCVFIGKGLVRAHITVGYGCCMFLSDGTSFTQTAQFTLAENKDIFIGENCMFAEDVYVSNTDGHPIYDCEGKRINKGKDVIIGHGVWIGRGVEIVKGAFVDSGAIVGAKSLVTGRLTANTISVGQPAKVIREKVAFDRQTTVRIPLLDDLNHQPAMYDTLDLKAIKTYMLLRNAY